MGQLVNKVKNIRSSKNEVIGYAGRLDPLAEGVTLLLVGDENKNAAEYNKLTKTYEFEVLFGVATDTYDILGIPVQDKSKPKSTITKETIARSLSVLKKKRVQQVPPYSSLRIQGKPLFYWARKNKLDEKDIPKKPIRIYELRLKDVRSISTEMLRKYVNEQIDQVQGDFRQQRIKKSWQYHLKGQESVHWPVVQLEAKVSKGTYIRSMANELGKLRKTSALAYSIRRTKVGSFSMMDAMRIR